MNKNHLYKITATLFVTFLLLAAFVTPALAVGVKTDDVLVVSSDVDDDLYAGARHFTLSASVHGDLIVFAQTITIQPGAVVEATSWARARTSSSRAKSKVMCALPGALYW